MAGERKHSLWGEHSREGVSGSEDSKLGPSLFTLVFCLNFESKRPKLELKKTPLWRMVKKTDSSSRSELAELAVTEL